MSKSVLTLLFLIGAVSPAVAQPIAKPTKVGSPQSICNGCYGTNTLGEPNDGKPMYQFSAPLSAFTGRLIDASVTPPVQSEGMRTVRAGFVRVAPTQRGTAPPRIYIGMGETLGVYSLGTFFDTTLAATPKPVNQYATGMGYKSSRNGFPFETIAPWDAFFYTEHRDANWTLVTADNQDRLWDADFDDRGNVYVAQDEYGWGIVMDKGETGGTHLTSKQFNASPTPNSQLIRDPNGIEPTLIFSLKQGTKYYAFVSNSRGSRRGTTAYDVTNTAALTTFPVSLKGFRAGGTQAVWSWSKNDAARILAVINGDGKLRVWDYDAYIANTAPIQTVDASAGTFLDVSFDDKGNIWAIENSKVVKLTPSGSSYTVSTFSPFPNSSFDAQLLHANAGYVAVGGSFQEGAYFYRTLYLFKMEGTGIRLLDTDDFFMKYYHKSPSGYAEAGNWADNAGGIEIIKHGTKTYLMYNSYGIGDVYQLEGSGPSVSATMKTTSFGTPNPNSQATQTGPFPGDIVTFRATTTATSAQTVQWEFGNPESQSKNIRAGTTGVDITHQFTGLNTATKVTTAKTVKVAFGSDASVSDSISVQLKLPTPRIAIEATDELVTGSGFEVIPGDKFVDASDGSVESHFATWTLGPVAAANPSVPMTPDAAIPVGAALGAHSVEFSASYGNYDVSNFLNPTAYIATIPARTYTIKPFIAKINTPTRNGAIVTYTANARYTTNTAFLSATKWTYKWSLTDAGGAEKAQKTGLIDIGTSIPSFDFATSLRTDDSKVTLTLTVDAGTVPDPAYLTYTTFSTIDVPVPVIQLTGCTHAMADCSIKAVAQGGGSTDGWQLSWVVKKGATTIKTGNTNPLATFKPTEAGNYEVTVTETVFDVSVTQGFVVAQTLCGPPPTAFEMSINSSCNPCSVGEVVEFSAQPFHYDIQDCDVLTWTFGDGGSASGRTASHAYTSSGTKSVKLKITNTNNPTGVTFELPLVISGPIITCTAPPASIKFNKNCISGSTCKTGTAIAFTARRGSGPLQDCDSVTWSFGDGGQGSGDTAQRTYSTAGTYKVIMTVSNNAGPSKTYEEDIVVVEGGNVGCSGSANETNVTGNFLGETSGCSSNNSTACLPGESITFTGAFFRYTQQTCDKFEWNFDDGSALSTAKQVNHTFANAGTYTVKFRVYNSTNPTGVTLPFLVRVGENVPAKPTPILAFQSAPTAASMGTPVTFTVNVTNDVNATGWQWNFGDGTGANNTQAALVGKTMSITHTFTKAGTFDITVKARNSEDTRGTAAPTGQALINDIVVTDVPEYKFLLPVATHGGPWRTDVQIYTPDPSVTPQTPLQMHATLRDIPATLEIRNSTQTYVDFVKTAFGRTNDFGPVIITARTKFAPQIWTRTYNQTDNGTYGQFIPAIRIDAAAGGGSAFGSGKYYLAGLRNGDRFRTNLGFVNPNPQPVNVTVKVFDDTQSQVGQFPLTLDPYELDQFPITHAKGVPNLSREHPFSLQIEVPAGQWLIAYASYIDNASDDPVYFQAVRESDLSLADNATQVIPGVGHVSDWRSDVTIFNPDLQSVTVDLAYHDVSGAKIAEAKGVQIRPREFVQYTDILKQGVLGNVANSTGILRVTVMNQFPPSVYPLTFARTYNDKGVGKTFGQGIGGFAAARANVKPGKPALVAGIRSDSEYYTNVGLVNVSTTEVDVTVKLLDPTSGAEQVLQSLKLQPNQNVIGPVTLPGTLETGSLKIEVTGGNIWAFCSMVDKGTADPEYVAATPLQ